MSDHEKTELEQNLTSRSTWIRLIYMLLFGFIIWLASIVLTVVVVLQFLHMLITGQRNDNLGNRYRSMCAQGDTASAVE